MFRKLIVFSLGFACLAGPASRPVSSAPETVFFHVSVDGNDAGPGTLEEPVATVTRAIRLAEDQPAPAEIVVRGGVYFLEETVNIRRSAKECRLVIRAAEGETVIFDGSIPVREASPVEGYPGVYTIAGNFPNDDPPNTWDTRTGRYFSALADLEAVSRVDYSAVVLDSGTMAVRCREGMSPLGLDIRMSRPGVMYGFYVYRSNVTLRDLEFRNFISRSAAAGVIVGPGLPGRGRAREGNFTAGVVIDSCRAVNCYFGFRVYTGGLDTKIIRSRAENCITGIWVSGVDTVVEDCRLVNDPGWYDRAPGSASYERAGIRFYHGPEDAVVRGNLVVNFRTPFSSKGSPGRYLFERNTAIGGEVAAVPDRGFVMRRNIFAGFSTPFQSDGNAHWQAEIDDNLFWGSRDFTAVVRDGERGGGPGNLFGDPLFAAPHLGDYRLLPGSPALGLGGAGAAGAFPAVPDDFHAPPRLAVSAGPRRAEGAEFRFAVESCVPVARLAYRPAGSDAWAEREFRSPDTFALADPGSDARFEFRVMDESGAWSGAVSAFSRAPARPAALVGDPEVIASHHGLLFLVESDGDLSAAVEYRDGEEWVSAGESAFRRGQAQPLLVGGLERGRAYAWRVSAAGKVFEGEATVAGPPPVMYVSAEGEDVPGAGSRERPYRTLQHALDRVMPGARVRLEPGLYFGAHRLSGRGGTAEDPVVIEGLYPDTVILDGLRREGTLLRLEDAPHVVVRNLNFRWFNGSGLAAFNCPGLRVTACRFHNQYWRSSSPVMGYALVIARSPDCMVDHCIFTRNRYSIEFRDSPRGRVLHNTATAGAVSLLLWRGESAGGIEARYNSFNWNGNQLADVRQPLSTIRDDSLFDYNNYAVAFRQPEGTGAPRGTYGPSIEPPFPYLPRNREFWRIDLPGEPAFSLHSLADWVKFSGQDRNSIFADPKWVDPAAGRFDVAADSPNLLPDGTVIGALGYLGEEPNMAPEALLVEPWNGQAVSGPFDLEAHASDRDGQVVRVVFEAGDRRLGEVTGGPPWVRRGVSLPPGVHELNARAVDDRGGETVSDPVTVTVLD